MSSSAVATATRDVVLLVGFPSAVELDLGTEPGVEVLTAAGAEEVREHLESREVAVLCLGPEHAAAKALELLEEIERHPGYRGHNVVLAAGADLELFQDLVAQDRLYYLTAAPPPWEAVGHILASAVAAYRRRSTLPVDEAGAAATHRALRLTERLARQPTPELAADQAVEAVGELVSAERCALFFYEPATETLWSRTPDGRERRESAAAGLVSFVARTRKSLCLEHVGADPRYEPEADNDSGPAEDRFLAVPVADPAADGRVWAVVVALRDADRQPFSEEDRDELERFAEQAAPVLRRLVLQVEIEAETARRHGVYSRESSRIFRDEALSEYLRASEVRGHLLEITPGWTGRTYWLLLTTFAAGLLFLLVGTVDEYANGAAVVRLEGRTNVTASLSGTVVSVEVEPGRRVEAGDLLVKLYGAQEEAELERVRREFEAALLERLRRPADPTTERSLGALRAQRNLAVERLEQRSVRAPEAGVVSDVWVRKGQVLAPGEVILALDGDDPRRRLVAFLPGHFRALLRPGMPLRFELQGYDYAFQHLVVDTVGDEVVGPEAARRALGPGGGAVSLSGPLVVVSARLPSATFESQGETYVYHDGFLGTAEVRVRSQSVLLTLLPGLKALWADRHGTK